MSLSPSTKSAIRAVCVIAAIAGVFLATCAIGDVVFDDRGPRSTSAVCAIPSRYEDEQQTIVASGHRVWLDHEQHELVAEDANGRVSQRAAIAGAYVCTFSLDDPHPAPPIAATKAAGK